MNKRGTESGVESGGEEKGGVKLLRIKKKGFRKRQEMQRWTKAGIKL